MSFGLGMLPGLPVGLVNEALDLGRRAVEALETQAELMRDPEPVTVSDDELQEKIRIANGFGYEQAKAFFGQKLEDILDGGYAQAERAKKLRELSVVMNGPTKKRKIVIDTSGD